MQVSLKFVQFSLDGVALARYYRTAQVWILQDTLNIHSNDTNALRCLVNTVYLQECQLEYISYKDILLYQHLVR